MSILNPIWSKQELGGEISYNKDIEEIAKKNAWHNLFEDQRWILLNPAEEVIDFYKKYIENPAKHIKDRIIENPVKIHDLGCGGGRHIFYFAEKGFHVCGSDLSENAIQFTQDELKRRGLSADLKLCPMTELPFENEEFDITISRAVINHATLDDLKKIIHEIARTTKKNGLFFATFSSERASDWKKGEEILPDVTYIPESGPEKGLVHTYLNATNTAALLEPFFRIEELYLFEHPPHIKHAPNANSDGEYFGSEYVVIGVRR